MPTAREEAMLELIPIPVKALIPAIPWDDKELQELAEDLRVMGCEGLLAKPWKLKSEEILREFKFEKGNQWIHTKRGDPDTWTPDVWNRVYGFLKGIVEGWASRRIHSTPGNSEAIMTRRRVSTRGIAGTSGNGGCWSS